jgi:hypothetical protein
VLRANADDIVLPRPTLTGPRAVAAAVQGLAPVAGTRADLWHLIVDNFAVDLDALAAILPLDEPEPVWLARRA